VSLLLVFITGAVFFSLLFFGHALVAVWIGAEAAAGAWASLPMLATGYWLSAATSPASTLSVACRRPELPLKVIVASAVLYAPAAYVMIVLWGVEGAAIAWLSLQAGHFCILVPLVHRQFLPIPFGRWLRISLLPFLLLGVGAFGAAKLIVILTAASRPSFQLLAAAAAVVVYGISGLYLLDSEMRTFLVGLVRRLARVRQATE